MKKTILTAAVAGLLTCACATKQTADTDFADRAIDRAVAQSLIMARQLEADSTALPQTLDDQGRLVTSDHHWWCAGFFPGTLWLLYEATGNDTLRDYAKTFTTRCEPQQYATDHHDLGFVMGCSYGNGYRLTADSAYRNVLLQSAKSLSTRYHAANGVIKSWDGKTEWGYPVIIDNMMNLELLEEATRLSGDSTFARIAATHADNTLKNHFRPDHSSYHVVDYDSITHTAKGSTHQGYSDSSAWARGQAWGLYGFTMMYRFTHNPAYLEQAQHIADFIISHPRLPADGIPYWDFDAPDIPDAPRDASAGAVMASAFIELSDYATPEAAKRYFEMGEKQLKSLAGAPYLADQGSECGFILKNSVGNFPAQTEVSKPLTYADYYFIEGLLRYKRHQQN